MGRKTQITKEIILEAALSMLIREGYAAINVKTLAAYIGCSTQPIVWHFENMQGFRKAFLEYCIAYTKEQFTVWNDSLDEMLIKTATHYIAIARNTPHLFRFVYVDNKEECKNHEIIATLQLDNTKKIMELLCRKKGLSEAQAAAFLMDYEFYIHGIASYTASGFCSLDEETVTAMVKNAMDVFLTGAGKR